jgi:LCP family protein required for cell wall assembly
MLPGGRTASGPNPSGPNPSGPNPSGPNPSGYGASISSYANGAAEPRESMSEDATAGLPRRRGRHAAPDEQARNAGSPDAPSFPSPAVPLPPAGPMRPPMAGSPAPPRLPEPPSRHESSMGLSSIGPAGLDQPAQAPWQQSSAPWSGDPLDQATAMVSYDPDATQLHQPVSAAPDLDAPTEMIPPDRLGLTPPGADLPGGAGNVATSASYGNFDVPDPDSGGGDQIPPRPRRVVTPPRRKRPRWVRILAWSGAFLGILTVAVGGFGYYEYRKINHNINRVDALAPNDPSIKDAAKQLNAENFLLIGSDSREGANSKYGQVGGQRSDTTILAHLSPDRQHAILVSFPRDAWVTIPSCVRTNGSTVAEHDDMFNSAFELGGPSCTIRTIQKMTGVKINHYVQVEFDGFKAMVDAVGGVPINSCEDAYDKDSGLRLHKGVQTLHGEQALSFVRARHNLGDGSDLDRINRQQSFLAAMMRVATSGKILLNPIRLTRFLNAASKSVTLDRQTTLNDLRGLAGQVRGLDPKRVTFLTAPIANRDYDPTGQKAVGGGRVLLDAAQGQLLWQSIINDKAAPAKTTPKAGTGPKPNNTPTVTVPPDQVSVKVINGVGTPRLATTVAAALREEGFSTIGTDGTSDRPAASIIRYNPANKAAAITLAAAVPGSQLAADATLSTSLELVIGRSYSSVRPVTVGQQVTVVNAPAGSVTQGGGPRTTPSPQPSINAGDASSCV